MIPDTSRWSEPAFSPKLSRVPNIPLHSTRSTRSAALPKHQFNYFKQPINSHNNIHTYNRTKPESNRPHSLRLTSTKSLEPTSRWSSKTFTPMITFFDEDRKDPGSSRSSFRNYPLSVGAFHQSQNQKYKQSNHSSVNTYTPQVAFQQSKERRKLIQNQNKHRRQLATGNFTVSNFNEDKDQNDNGLITCY
eukprot:UN23220